MLSLEINDLLVLIIIWLCYVNDFDSTLLFSLSFDKARQLAPVRFFIFITINLQIKNLLKSFWKLKMTQNRHRNVILRLKFND